MGERGTDRKLRISILTPVYNGSRFLDELIASILQQDYACYEHVLIDDGSNDQGATVNILRRHPHLKWKSQKNVGQYLTQNELIKMASGDVVTIICADDFYPAATVLSNVAGQFARQPDLDIVVGRTNRLVEINEGRFVFDPDPPAFIAKRIVRYTLGIQHCAVFVRRRFLEEKSLYFDASYAMRGDWDWILRVLGAGGKIGYTNEVFASWRLHATQTSRTGRVGKSEARRVCETHEISYPLHLIFHRVMNLAGMLNAVCSLGWQLGPFTLLKVVLSKAQNALRRIDSK